MEQLVDITDVEVVGSYRLRLTFADGTVGEVDFAGRKWRGVLRQIIPTADRAKATVKVKVKIVDPGERLLPEMSATASFLNTQRTDAELHEPPKIWLPKRAVADGKVAVIGADGRVTLRGVQTGETRESMIEIRSGVRQGERIVTENVEQLKDGQLVRSPES